ncbi:MAG: hypothetical protein JOY82_15225 [Streptosporangiaceae bacterium]|nr:hypothetical protein [Streptosporangiaceae bacterium]MBV9855843.1 hypothetical protein [Streptosporangiaceae bacterium]
MLALQAAATHGASLQPLLIIFSVLAVFFWRVAFKIALIILLIGILVSIRSGGAALLPTLHHLVR